MSELKFKVGDVVKVIDPYRLSLGRIGTITGRYTFGGNYNWITDIISANGHCLPYNEKQIEHAKNHIVHSILRDL